MPLIRVEVLQAHLRELLREVGGANLDRYPEADSLHLVEGGLKDWAVASHHILEEMQELADWVGMGLQIHILE